MRWRTSLPGMLADAREPLEALAQLRAAARDGDGPAHHIVAAALSHEVFDQPGLAAHSLRQLERHILELRERTMAGDYAALDEFFGLYVVEDAPEYRRPAGSP